ncbi:MAG: hypothetical protein LBS21_02425 [Clostridiales bacterium]|jgi:hypothetical protein|nr:hypothetical protein [Clostridiales bacterium]
MYKVIGSKRYNTETAKLLAVHSSNYPRSDFHYYEESLYVKTSGEYFLHGEGNGLSPYAKKYSDGMGPGEKIIPFSLKRAKEWAEAHLDGEKYDEIFGGVEESSEESGQRVNLILPSGILNALKERKERSGITISAQIIKALRDAGYGKDE